MTSVRWAGRHKSWPITFEGLRDLLSELGAICQQHDHVSSCEMVLRCMVGHRTEAGWSIVLVDNEEAPWSVLAMVGTNVLMGRFPAELLAEGDQQMQLS